MLQRQFLKYKTTGSLGDKLLGDKMQGANPYANNYGCRSIPSCS